MTMNPFPALLPGDRLLTLKDSIFSAAICWWLSSDWSHLVPILNEDGETLNITHPTVRPGHVSDYLREDAYTVALLRPRMPLTPEQTAD
jgi:hypothetical protein